MKIGFYMRWDKELPGEKKRGRFIGEELYANSMCNFLEKIDGVDYARLYAPNYLPNEKLDFMIYFDDFMNERNFAGKNIFYMQSSPGKDLSLELKGVQKKGYDGYLFISEKLLGLHKKDGFNGIFLPFGVDTSVFYPRDKSEKFVCDVAYIGNDVKGLDRTNRYLLPAVSFDFALYGNWKVSKREWLRRVLGLWKIPYYKKKFIEICKGSISQDNVPVLYGSTKINLNCTQQGGIDWDSTTLRPLDILACKGFLISDRMPSLEKVRDGVVFSEGGEDLKNKIKYYLDHPAERKRITERGYRYVIKHDKIEKRMKELYDYLRGLA